MIILQEIAQGIALFPLLLPIWQERPLRQQDLSPGPYPYEPLGAQTVALQEEALTAFHTDFRALVASELGATGSERGGEVLLDTLPRQQDPDVIATMVTQLAHVPCEGNRLRNALQPLLTHESTTVRRAATRAYGLLPNARVERLVSVATKESEPAIRMLAWEALSRPDLAPRVRRDIVDQAAESEIPAVRAAAVSALCAHPSAAAKEGILRQTATNGPPPARRALAGAVPRLEAEMAFSLAQLLAEDRHPLVRGRLAEVLPEIEDQRVVEILLKLAEDPDPEVRRLSIENLGAFAVPESLRAIVAHYRDTANKVRAAAEASAIRLHDSIPVIDPTVTVLRERDPAARYRAYRVLEALRATDQAALIAARLRDEQKPANIAAAVDALGALGYVPSIRRIMERASHPSARVREAVADTLGLLDQEQSYPVLKNLAFDADQNVRYAAVVAIGRTGDGDTFASTLQTLLKNVSKFTSTDRRAACWAASRLRPVSRDNVSRMVVIATTPIIPMDMGMREYDVGEVLASTDFALAACALADADYRDEAERVLSFHATEPRPDASSSEMAFLSTPELREAARQARLYLDGKEIEATRRPLRPFPFSYRPAD